MQDSSPNIGNHSERSLDNKTLPRLYSKRVILIFSLLFSTIFSAVLLFSNLRQLDKRRAGLHVLLFSILYLIATAVTIMFFQLPPNFSFIANVLGAAILNEYFWNKHIGQEREFEKKKWYKPAIISFLVTVPFFLLLLLGA